MAGASGRVIPRCLLRLASLIVTLAVALTPVAAAGQARLSYAQSDESYRAIDRDDAPVGAEHQARQPAAVLGAFTTPPSPPFLRGTDHHLRFALTARAPGLDRHRVRRGHGIPRRCAPRMRDDHEDH